MLARNRSFWRNVVHRRAVDRDLEDEISGAHAELTEEYVRQGMNHDAAKRAATLALGHIHTVSERIRAARFYRRGARRASNRWRHCGRIKAASH